jgi:eukaryotic-like serine/threonine-protein kinase
MSPEQIAGANVDYRTDLYSFGCMLFEMLTGSRPFSSDFNDMLVRRLTEEPPRVRDLLQTVPPEVDALVTDLMAKDPAQRTITQSGVVEVLTKALTHEIEL